MLFRLEAKGGFAGSLCIPACSETEIEDQCSQNTQDLVNPLRRVMKRGEEGERANFQILPRHPLKEYHAHSQSFSGVVIKKYPAQKI